MTLEKAGCKKQCFQCPYPDCVVENAHEKQEKRRRHSARYDAAHREGRLNYFRNYYNAHKEAKNKYSREHYAAYPEEYKEFLRAYWKEYNKARYQRLKSMGICTECKKRTAAPGSVKCEECKKADRERYAKKKGI